MVFGGTLGPSPRTDPERLKLAIFEMQIAMVGGDAEGAAYTRTTLRLEKRYVPKMIAIPSRGASCDRHPTPRRSPTTRSKRVPLSRLESANLAAVVEIGEQIPKIPSR